MKLLPEYATGKRLPHLQLARLRRRCDDVEGSREEILRQVGRALEYGATVDQVNNVCGHWPRLEGPK